MAGLALFTAASAACGLAPDVGWLIAARAVQGAGGALVMPMTMALLSAAYPPAQRGQALGIYAGITGLAVLGGPVVGGAVVQGASWHWIFWLNLPIGLALIGLVRQRIAESAVGPSAALDLPGLVLVTGAALGTVWSLMHGTSDGWTSPSVLGPLAVGLGLLGGFLLWEQRTPRPMVPLRLFRAPAFAGGNAAVFLMTGALYGTLFFASQFLQTAQGHGPLDAGLRLLPWTGVLFVVGPLAGRLLGRFGGRPLLVGGLALQAVGMAWLGRIVTPDLGFVDLVAPFILAGVGVSLAMPAAQHAVVSAVRTSEIGTASGTFSMLRFLGGSFGVALSATVFAMAGGFGSPQHFSAGFAAALGVSAILSLFGALAGLGLPGRVVARG
jgi:EmrB/QacA subfamily drug resistance transporter